MTMPMIAMKHDIRPNATAMVSLDDTSKAFGQVTKLNIGGRRLVHCDYDCDRGVLGSTDRKFGETKRVERFGDV